jgi:hypothetical protein
MESSTEIAEAASSTDADLGLRAVAGLTGLGGRARSVPT